jgi:hypothetical protein
VYENKGQKQAKVARQSHHVIENKGKSSARGKICQVAETKWSDQSTGSLAPPDILSYIHISVNTQTQDRII